MTRLRLAFWMKDPAGAPGDVVDVPDAHVDALVKAGIGHAVDTAAPAAEPAEPAGQEAAAPPATRRKAAKAATD